MPKRVPPLTQLQIRNAKPADKPYKLADGGGLYIEVTPAGGKHWRMKYRRPNGKEAKLHFGAFRRCPSATRAKSATARANCWRPVPTRLAHGPSRSGKLGLLRRTRSSTSHAIGIGR